MKLPKKYAEYIFYLLTAFFMSMVMSFALVLAELGPTKEFIVFWLKSWAIAFPVALCVAPLVVPRIRKFVNKITE